MHGDWPSYCSPAWLLLSSSSSSSSSLLVVVVLIIIYQLVKLLVLLWLWLTCLQHNISDQAVVFDGRSMFWVNRVQDYSWIRRGGLCFCNIDAWSSVDGQCLTSLTLDMKETLTLSSPPSCCGLHSPWCRFKRCPTYVYFCINILHMSFILWCNPMFCNDK